MNSLRNHAWMPEYGELIYEAMARAVRNDTNGAIDIFGTN